MRSFGIRFGLGLVCWLAAWSPLSADELSFEVVPDRQVLKVGDTLTLTVRLTIAGPADKYEVKPLSSLELDGFETISVAPLHRRGSEGGRDFEERLSTIKLIATRPGRTVIPSLTIPYTSKLDGSSGTLTSQELAVIVSTAPASGRPSAVLITGLFLLVAILSVAWFYVWFLRTKTRRFRQEEQETRAGKFARWADELQKLLATGNKDQFTQQAYLYINEYIEDSYQLGLKGRKPEQRLALLETKGVAGSLRELYQTAHGYYEELKFGDIRHGTDDLDKLLRELRALSEAGAVAR